MTKNLWIYFITRIQFMQAYICVCFERKICKNHTWNKGPSAYTQKLDRAKLKANLILLQVHMQCKEELFCFFVYSFAKRKAQIESLFEQRIKMFLQRLIQFQRRLFRNGLEIDTDSLLLYLAKALSIQLRKVYRRIYLHASFPAS